MAAFVIFMSLHYAEDIRWFRWDAGDYWSLAEAHRLLHFPAEIRGYFYPMLLAPARYIFDLRPDWGYLGYRILSSAVYAYMLAVALPAFYQRAFGGRFPFWRRLIVPILVAAIFPGLVVYPLSDLPAVCLMLGAVLCGLHSPGDADRSKARYGSLLACGILAYGAYNTRTIFLFPVLVMVLAVPLLLYRGHTTRSRSWAALVFVTGVAIAGVPQSLINLSHGRTWVPEVITTTDGKSLFAQQLLWGIVVQRYETTLDPSARLPAVIYPDERGRRLVQTLHIARDLTVADYLKLVIRHPANFAGIYGRHIVNGLDVRDGDAYSTVQAPSRDVTSFCNFLVVFTGLAIMCAALRRCPMRHARNAPALFWGCFTLLPVLTIIPGAIETRFFLSLHLALYSAIAFNGEPKKMVLCVRTHWLPLSVSFVIAAAVFFAVSQQTMADFEYGSQHTYALFSP